MADVTITPALVVPGADARKSVGVAGETIVAGKAVYETAADLWMLADADAATAIARGSEGVAVALTGSSLNQPIVVQRGGKITLGGTLTPGAAYMLSGATGGICPVADVGAGEYYVQLGLAESASVLNLDPHYTGVSA